MKTKKHGIIVFNNCSENRVKDTSNLLQKKK